MSQTIVGKWGKSLAVRIPREVVNAARVQDGERVEVELRNGDILIRRVGASAKADARRAAEEILAEAKNYSLGDITISELLNEDRR